MIPFLVTFTGLAVNSNGRNERSGVPLFSRSSPPLGERSRARRAVDVGVERRPSREPVESSRREPDADALVRGARSPARATLARRRPRKRKGIHPSGQSLTGAERETRWAGAASAEIPPAAR